MRWLLAPVLGALVVTALPLSAGAGSAPSRLPDLGVAPLQHMLIQLTAEGRKRLRFTTSIANVGAGPIEVVASRPKLGSEWTGVAQRILRTDGSSSLVSTPDVKLVFVGSSSHGHWHVRGGALYELRRIGGGPKVRTRVKRGFCFFDSNPYRGSLPGAPAKAAYPRVACGKKRARKIAMGISIGWRDDYYWRISGQAMDITSLPIGKYRLVVKVDPRNWFRESNERNNVAWVDLQIGDQLVKVLGRNPRL
jgi:hypothetical protein